MRARRRHASLRALLACAACSRSRCSALAGVAAFGIAPDTTLDAVPTQAVVRDLPLPALADAGRRARRTGARSASSAATRSAACSRARASTTRRRMHVPAHAIPPRARSTSCARARRCSVATDEDGRPAALRYPRRATATCWRSSASGDALRARRATPAADVRVDVARPARSNRRCSARPTPPGLPDAVTLALADVFAGDIDFYHDLRRGDRFAVVYETRYVDGEPVGAGRVLAAEFVNRGRTLPRVPVARARRQRRRTTTTTAAARARRSCARRWSSRASRRASRSRASIRSCRRGARTRASTSPRRSARRCARPRDGERRVRGRAERLRQRRDPAPRRHVFDALRRTCRASRRGSTPGDARAAGRHRSATSARRAGRPARTCTTSFASPTCSATR